MCTRPIPCSKARWRLRGCANSPRPTASPRWRSPTPTTCSVRSNSRTRWQRRGSSRSSAVRSRSILPIKTRSRARIVLLAARENGYRSLMRLNSRAFLETAPNEPPHLRLAWLEGETEGLIALTGGPGGPLDAAILAGQSHLAELRCEALARLFGDRMYIELQRHGSSAERGAEPALIALAYARGIPLVAANAPLFARQEDYEAHDALICIAEGRLVVETDRRQFTPEHRFKTRAEMAALFADLPEAVASTVEIARRCAFRPRVQAPILPRFSVGADGAAVDEAAELRKRAEAGLDRRIKAHGVAPGRTEKRGRIGA